MHQGGYTGKILRINLTDKTSTVEALPPELARDYIGGAGFGIKYLYDEVPKGSDPLGPANKLIFASGPFSGTKVPCASRMAVTAKSPLTGAVGMALSGGHFPVEIKFAGYDALIIEGEAAEPTYVSIKDDKVAFKSAKMLMGLNAFDTQQAIKNQLHDQNTRVSCIGPAGENLSKMASIMNEARAVGRKGLGAVMGAKKLKAIAVRGTGDVRVASEEKFKTARAAMNEAMKESPVLYPHFAHAGTPGIIDLMSELGVFPTKNYSTTGEYSPMGQIGEKANESRIVYSEACYNCPVGCSQVKLARSGAYTGTLSEGPEFETLYSLGGATGVESIDAIIAADRLCDELGIDTISAGVAVGFAMECYEKGVLTDADTGGLKLNFGNDEAMIALIKRIAYRTEGLGDLLSDGVKAAAAKIGRGTEKYALHVKGLELPGYDVRGAKAHGLNYATSFTGADHCRGYAFQEMFNIPVPYPVDRFAIEGKGKLTKWNQDVRAATTDCPTMCGFILDMALPGVALQNTADLMEAVTGLAFSPEQVQQVGERVNNLARAFNVREGFTRADDTLPDRIMNEPVPGGNSKGQQIPAADLDTMLDEYYTERGWDVTTGVPTREKLEELGLERVAAELGQ